MSRRHGRRKEQARVPEAAAEAASRTNGARALLVASLALTPLALSRFSLEAFEFPKALLVVATAILLAGVALARLAAVEAPGRTAGGFVREALRDPVAVAVLALVASAGASTLSSISPLTSLVGEHESFGGLVTVLALSTLFFAARQLAASPGTRLLTMAAPVVPATAAALYAMVQAAGADPIRWEGTASFSGVMRAFATLGHPNLLGAYLSMTAPLTAGLVVLALRRGRRVPGAILLVAALAQVATVVITSSRAAWLAVVASAVLLAVGWFAAGARRAALLVAGVLLLAALALAGASLLRPVEPGALASLGERVRRMAESPTRAEIWRAAVAIHGEHAWLGSGLDTFRLAFSPRRTTAYAELDWNITPTHAHNGALQVLATQGLGGVAALGALAATLVWRLSRLVRSGPRDERGSALTLASALAAFTVASLFGGTSPATIGLAAVLAGIVSGRHTAEETRPSRSTRDLDLGAGTALVAVAMLFAVNAPTLSKGLAVGLGLLAPALVAGLAARAVARLRSGAPHAEEAAQVKASRRSAPAAGSSRRVRAARVGAWALTAVAILVLVVRPLAADHAARRGLVLAAVDPEAAIAEHRRSVVLAPWREVLWLRLGTTSHAAAAASRSGDAAVGRFDIARGAFERATLLAPPDPYAHMRLAGTLAELARRGRVPAAAAVSRADQALLLDPNNAHFYVAAANIALVAGDSRRAQAYAHRCLERFPRFGAPRYLLGRIALQAGDVAAAVREMDAAVHAEWYGDLATRDFVAAELERARARGTPGSRP